MNNKLKLLLALLTVSTSLGIAAACGGDETPPASSSPSSSSSEPAELAKYTVKFLDYDDAILSEEEYEEGAKIEKPADPTREGDSDYVYEFTGWDKEVSDTATADVTYKATYKKIAIEYTVTFKADGVQVGDSLAYSADDKTIEEPTVPTKNGYLGVWESYTLDGSHVVVNAVYTPIVYTVTFKADGEQVGEVLTYTVEDKEIEAPAVPTKAHYNGAWETYELTTGNVEINAVYTAIEYTVTFKADGEQVGEVLTYTVEDKEIEAPAVPTKAHYNGVWETYELTTGNVEVNAIYTAIEYTVTFKADGVQIGEVLTYTVENNTITEPTIPAKEGYGAKWETYALDGGNKVVNAVYNLGEYTVTFKADGAIVGTETYTIENKNVTAPAVPAKEGYNGAWEAYELTTGDIEVNAVYTAIEYTITFVHPRTQMQLADPITFTIENKELVVFPEVPADLQEPGYRFVWDKTVDDLTLADMVVYPTPVAVEYTVVFKNGEDVVDTVVFTVNGAEKDAPAVPEKTGYTGAWETYSFENFVNQEVNPVYTANTYTITYDAKGGTASTDSQDVTFDDTYTLATATSSKLYQEFVGWADEDGNMFVAGEVWDIASNVTLTAVYSDGITFSAMSTIPSYFKAADTTESLSIVELDGNKVLQIKNKATESAPAMIVTLEFLESFFADENVQYVAFDAKAKLGNYNNFRRVTLRSNGTFSADCYVTDLAINGVPITGIRNDAFKTFYFSRSDYQAWIDQGVTEQRLIASGGIQGDDCFYVDNIRPVTSAEFDHDVYSFEGDGVRENDAGRTLLFYTTKSKSDWSFNMQVGTGQTFTNVGYTNDNVTDGIRALKFTKAGGNVTVNFNSAKQAYNDICTKTGYWAIDVFVPVGANARVSTEHTGLTNSVIPGASLIEGKWNTIYIADSKNSLTIGDENGGEYFVDNIRSLTEAEFKAAQNSFEYGTVGLRTNLLNDETAHSGSVYIYNRGTDYSGVKASLNFGEGNTDGDANAISNARFDTTNAHSGNYCIAFDKGNGYVAFSRHSESQALVDFAGGCTFWIYSTVEIDGVNSSSIVNGVNGKLNGGEGIIIPANTWTQITLQAEDIEPNGRFLILQGNWAGKIYIDDFAPLN